jgi:hypothetical protein
MRRETDIILEKHSLNKIKETYLGKENMPCVELLQTFKDFENLYFLTEILDHKQEIWAASRSYGFINDDLSLFNFK